MKRNLRRQLAKLVAKHGTSVSIEMAEMLDKADPGQLEVLGSMLVHFDGEFGSKAARSASPEAVAAGLHEVVERAIRGHAKVDAAAARVSCRRGCSHCCKLPTHILKAEARLLVEHARANAIPIDLQRLRAQHGFSLQNWHQLPPADRACVFLGDDGSCRVYEQRPSVCRKYQVVSDPANCDTVGNYGAPVTKLVVPEAEAAVSAAMTYNAHGPMATMLLDVIEEVGAAMASHAGDNAGADCAAPVYATPCERSASVDAPIY